MAVIIGTPNADNLIGTGSADQIDGLEGNDLLEGRGGNDVLVGGAGNDVLTGGAGSDRMFGGAGNDTYNADSNDGIANLVENANEGRDRVVVGNSWELGANFEELVFTGSTNAAGLGNELNNLLVGNNGNNYLNAGDGDDEMAGGAGNDTLLGGAGKDHLNGNGGADRLEGGTGINTARGEGGADVFVFNSDLGPANLTNVLDFRHGTDKIELDRSVFTNLNAGSTLGAPFFHSGAGATATFVEHRIIYDTANGNLYYDADGTGAAAQVLIGIVTLSGSALTNTDFSLVA